MRAILKQFFKTILKKSFLMIAFIVSFFVVIGTVSIGSFSLTSIVSSNNEVNKKGNSSDIILDGLNPNLKISYKSETLSKHYKPSIAEEQVLAFNLNGVDPRTQELVVFPVSQEDYKRLNDGQKVPNWDQTIANNENLISDNPDYFNSPFISYGSLLMFRENAVRGYNLSRFDSTTNSMKVHLDPRWISFVQNPNDPEDILMEGFYDNFSWNTVTQVAESMMVVNDISKSFNPKSLKGENIRKFGLHRNSMLNQSITTRNFDWNHNIERVFTIQSFLLSMPNIAKGDDLPEPNSGVPYMEKQDAIKLEWTLDFESLNPLVKLFLYEQDEVTREEILNPTILMTPFQISNSQFETIPTNPNDLAIFQSNLERYVFNLTTKIENDLASRVNSFKEELVLSTLSDYDWTTTENISFNYNEKTYLFTSREKNEINKIVLAQGQNIFNNYEGISEIKDTWKSNKNNTSFSSKHAEIKSMAGFIAVAGNHAIYDSIVIDSNTNIPDAVPYPESITTENPQGVIPTVKERRLIKDVLNDILVEFEKVNKDPKLNYLTEKQQENLTEKEKFELIDYRKIKEITSKPIYYEYTNVIEEAQSRQTYTSSLNNKTTFKSEETFVVADPSNAIIQSLNFENYGVVVSSKHFEDNNLKFMTQEMLDEGKDLVKEKLKQNPQLDVDRAMIDYLASLDQEYKIEIQNRSFYILGAGDAPDFKAPIIDSTRPLPNSNDEAVIYVNESQMGTMRGGMRGPMGKTINIKSPQNSSGIWNHINEISESFEKSFLVIDEKQPFKIYSNSDYLNNSNINTFRWQYSTFVIAIFSTVVFAISLILFVIVVYILFMIIKFLFETLSFSIAIARANGIPRRKVILALLSILVGLSLIITTIVFVGSYFLTPLMFSFIAPFWFVPLSLVTFPWWGIPAILTGVVLILNLIIFLISWSSLQNPILLTLSGNDIVKTNKLSKIIRSNKIILQPLSKLRISMMSTKIGKISLISSLTGLAFGISTATVSLTDKVDTSQSNNILTKNYSYAFDYHQPSYNTGLIKISTLNALGEINPRAGIKTILEKPNAETSSNNPYYGMLYDENGKVIPNSLLAKRIIVEEGPNPTDFPRTTPIPYNNDPFYEHIPGDPNSIFRTFENVLLPSMDIYTSYSNNEPNLTFNGAFLVDVLDIDLGTFIGIPVGNLWSDHIANSLPFSIRYQLESLLVDYREAILAKYPWYANFLILENPGEPISEFNQPIRPIKMNTSLVFDTNQARLTDDYLWALGVFLGDDELNNYNVVASYNYSGSEPGDETYTYVNADRIVSKNKTENIKLMGIRENSEYVNLTSSNGRNLNELISDDSNKIVINEGAAYKNNLRVGSKIEIEVRNDYYGTVKRLLSSSGPNINFEKKKVELEVVGISQDSIGQTYWINQSLANELTNLKYGQYVSDLHSREKDGHYIKRQDFSSYVDVENQVVTIDEPFNGVFTKNINPKVGQNSLPLTSTAGIYPISFDYGKIFGFSRPNDFYSLLTQLFLVPYDANNPEIVQIYDQLENINTSQDMENFLKENFSNLQIFVGSIQQNISYETIVPGVVGLDGVIISDQIFDLLKTTSSTASLVIGLIFVPLLMITILVSMLSLSDDFRKSLTILRILGMNKRQTVSSIMLIYAPVILIGWSLGLLIGFFINLSFQSIIFASLSVFISSTLNWGVYGIATGAMLGLIGLTVLIMTIILLREKLEKSIKF